MNSKSASILIDPHPKCHGEAVILIAGERKRRAVEQQSAAAGFAVEHLPKISD